MFQRLKGGKVMSAKPNIGALCRGFIGGSLGTLVLLLITNWYGNLFIMAPFGATCVLLFALPEAPLAQPRSVIGGHFICALIGLLTINFLGSHILVIALSVGLSIFCMQFFRILHAPAGANPILIIMSGIHDYHFLLTPVFMGSVLLVLIALIVNNIGKEARWPNYWFGYDFNKT